MDLRNVIFGETNRCLRFVVVRGVADGGGRWDKGL